MGRKRQPKASNYIFKKLFEEYIFNIPDYQRCYSWGSKERGDLFNDITEDLPKNENVFMSTIVTLFKETITIGAESYNRVDLVDGQQRITTIVILLKAIWLRKKELGDSDTAIDDLLIKKDPGKLTYNVLDQGKHSSNTILSNYIANGDYPNDYDISSAAQKNLKSAFEECYRFVRYQDYKEKDAHIERSIDSIDGIKTIILTKYQVVYYELPEEREVYKAFELLNSRGLPVSSIDNFKCQLMGISFAIKDTNAINQLHTIWTDIYNIIGEERIVEDDIISIPATLYKALDDNRTRPKSVHDAMEYFCDVATKKIPYDNVPVILKHGDPKHDTKGYRCRKISELIKKTAAEMVSIHKDKTIDAVTDVKHARILLIAIRFSEYSEEDKRRLLEKWEKTTFRLFCLHRKDSRSFVGEYIDCSNAIIENKPVNEVLKQIGDIGAQFTFDDGLDKIKGSAWYPDYNNDVIYIMRRYDEYLAKGNPISETTWKVIWESDPATTIEHIFPKTYPTKQSQVEQFKKDWEHGGRRFSQKKLNGFVHNIGNLTILVPGVNSKAGQKSYAEKIDLYGTTMLIHPRKNSKYLVKNFWVEDSIKAREKDILEFIKEKWGK